MRNNIEHIKAILNVFLDSERTFIRLTDIIDSYPVTSDNNQDLFHHYLQLVEQGFITNSTGSFNPKELGVNVSGQGNIVMSNPFLRLTASGHQFADTLNTPTFMEKIADFKDQPLDVVKDVGKELISSYLKKKLGID